MKIVDHNWVEGELHDHQTTLSIPFGIIKKDEPFATARHILDEIVGTRSNDRYHLWAKKIISQHHRTIRRLEHCFNIDHIICINRTKKKPSRNHNRGVVIKFGIRVPANVKQALLFDRENGNNKWAEAMEKEMKALIDLKCFEFHPPSH